jgi:Flp pilus assembly protein protease CpaA
MISTIIFGIFTFGWLGASPVSGLTAAGAVARYLISLAPLAGRGFPQIWVLAKLVEALQMLEQQYAEKHKLAHAREFVTNHDRDLMSRLDD